MGGTFQILTVDEIVEVNRRMIAVFGGLFLEGDNNLANPGSLEHVLEEAEGSLFGQELHPSIIEKAGVICWRIIVGHIFHDGNKRTGLEVCRLILELNGYQMQINRESVEVALRVARSEMSLEEFTEWIDSRTSNVP